MKNPIAGLPADTYPPERAKFRIPLLLAHGLWTGGWCWRPWATHFSNLGWECRAVSFRGRYEDNRLEILKKLSFADCVEDLGRAIRACPAPPVLLAHGVGATIALEAAETQRPAALVLISPSPPRDLAGDATRVRRLLHLKYFPLLFFRSPFRLEEKDFRRSLVRSLPPAAQKQVFDAAVPDSTRLIRDFFTFHGKVEPGRLRCPVLILGGGADVIAPPAPARAMAERLGADFKFYPDRGHWMIEVDGEQITRDIHRWIIRTMGDEILLAEFP